MRVLNLLTGVVLFSVTTLLGGAAAARTIDFEDVSLEEQSDLRVVLDEFDDIVSPGYLSSGGAQLINENQPWGWSFGFLVSNRTDTETPGYDPTVGDFGAVVNDSSSFAGSGADGSSNFAVAFGSLAALDPTDISQLEQLPHVLLPENHEVLSAQVTNTTWAGISMNEGDGFAKVFGGETGEDPDFFRLSVYGSQAGEPLMNSVDLLLADYRSSDPEEDFILDEWRHLDLAPLAEADHLYFNLASSDVGDFGMNTPSYFAIDNIELRELSGISGDVSGDGLLDANDMDLVCSDVAVSSGDLHFDLDEDGVVGQADVEQLLTLAGGLRGDANLDTEVDFADFLSLTANFGNSASWSSGDFDCDGTAEFSDFLVLSENFGASLASHSVPEPAVGHLLLVLLAALYGRCCRFSRSAAS